MKRYSFVLSKDETVKIKDIYQGFIIPSSDNNIDHVYRRNNTDLILYKSGKLLLRGNDLKNEITFIKNVLNRLDHDAVGSSLIGSLDVFGPVTVCSAFVSVNDIEYLESLNIKDAKTVNDKFIVKHAPEIAKRLNHSLIILDPIKYNALVEKGYNMNKIKAHLHNQAIVSLHAKLKGISVPIVLEKFCQPQQYYNYLKDELLVNRDILFVDKDEDSHIAVAAATIIARYGFLYSIQKCSKKAGFKLAKGSSKVVDQQLEQLIMMHDINILDEVAKTNFKNVAKLTVL